MSNFKSISQQFTHGYTIPSVDIESPDQSRYKILINGLAGPDLSPVSEGSRNSTLARLAGIWIAEGRTLQDALYSAHEWNMGNNPPLSAAEVETTVRSIAATHERNHGVIVKERVEIVEPSRIVEVKTPLSAIVSLDDVPSFILRPGGFLGEYFDYLHASTVSSCQVSAYLSGNSMLGTLLSQKVMTETGLRTNLYTIYLASSGTGKDAPLKTIYRLMKDPKSVAAHLLGPEQLASSAALWASLESDPCLLFLIDEVGDLMGQVNMRADSPKSALAKALKKLYTSTERGNSKQYAGKKLVVKYHCSTIFGTGTPGPLFDNMSVSDVIDGFAARTLIVVRDTLAVRPRPITAFEPPDRLLEMIRGFAETPIIFADEQKMIPKPRIVPKTPEAAEMFGRWQDRYIDMQNQTRHDKDGISSIYARVPEQAHKYALILAASRIRGIPVAVEYEDVLQATSLMDYFIPQMIHNIKTSVAYNPQDALLRRVKGVIAKQGHITKESVFKMLKDCTHKQAQDMINILIDSGEVVKVNTFDDVTKSVSYELRKA